MKFFVKNKILTIIFFTLAGCATQEYRNAENECSYEAFRQYPVNNVSTVVTLTRPVQVPTGQTNCQTYYIGYTAQTTCNQVMRTDYQPYQQTVIQDTNSSYRKTAINSCAQNTCYQKFGNSECKTKN
jgi:hypothetical protein